MISVIIPCYNEQETIDCFYKEINKISNEMAKYKFEFIFIDDGSNDKTMEKLIHLSNIDSRVKYISFSRNFGKESSIYAGLQHSKGDYIVIIDVDLQDPPSLLPKMMKIIEEEDYDSVATRRVTRKGEPIIRSLFARMFYKLINKISNTDIVDGARDYRLMTRQMVQAILSMEECNRFSKGIFSWVGFKTKWLEYENLKRVAGETKWSFWKLFKYSLEGITAFSIIPLQFASIFGVILSIIAFVMVVFIVIRTLIYGDPVDGWPSLMCVITMIGGIQLLTIGILGNYLAKTYLETKKRPIYIVKRKNI